MTGYKEAADKLEQPYVTAGNRLYVIGSQNGLFPDNGGHIEGEMGGVWNHPIKLLDGFFLGIRDALGTKWPLADTFRAYPFYTEHEYHLPQASIIRRQFVPDNEELLFVTLEYTNLGEDVAAELLLTIKSDLRPGWLGTEVDGRDEAIVDEDRIVFVDAENPWAVAARSDAVNQQLHLDSGGCPFETKGNGVFASIAMPIVCPAGQMVTIQIAFAGSLEGKGDAVAKLQNASERFPALWKQKEERYSTLDRMTHVDVPNPAINDTVQWVKYNTDWLIRDVPSVGSGLGAGLPEYPWWFGCDNGYALQGVLAAGWFSLAKNTLRLLVSVSNRENGNGRIIHEVSSTNVVFNPGNTQETPQFCMTVWDVFAWTGDLEFLQEMYPAVEKAIQWTLSMAPDGDDLPVGYGIMEVENLNAKLIDTAVYTERALVAYANMSDVLGYMEVAVTARARADSLRNRLLTCFWLEDEGLYADVLVDSQGMNQHLDIWAARQSDQNYHRAAAEYRQLIDWDAVGEKPFLLKNWVISTPVEVGIAPTDCAERLLERMRTPEFRGPSGLYLSGIDQTHMMTISTSVQAVAECRYGHVDEALRWMEMIAATRDVRVPGSISEMSPDYGCFVQAWTIYGVLVPIVKFMFGVQPVAHERRCVVHPQMPSDWDEATLADLKIGSNEISLHYRRVGDEQHMTIQTKESWRFEFLQPIRVTDGAIESESAVSVEPGSSVTVVLSALV